MRTTDDYLISFAKWTWRGWKIKLLVAAIVALVVWANNLTGGRYMPQIDKSIAASGLLGTGPNAMHAGYMNDGYSPDTAREQAELQKAYPPSPPPKTLDELFQEARR